MQDRWACDHKPIAPQGPVVQIESLRLRRQLRVEACSKNNGVCTELPQKSMPGRGNASWNACMRALALTTSPAHAPSGRIVRRILLGPRPQQARGLWACILPHQLGDRQRHTVIVDSLGVTTTTTAGTMRTGALAVHGSSGLEVPHGDEADDPRAANQLRRVAYCVAQ